MSEAADSAVYQARLADIFKSCDSGDKGFLSLLEFERLCRQLRLQPHKQRLYTDLHVSRPTANTKVYFEDFQSALVSLLREVGPHTLAAGEPGQVSSTDQKADDDSSLRRKQDDVTGSHPDLRLHFPADMTEDDPEFAPFVEKSPHRHKASPPSPLKRACVEMSAS